MEAPGDYYSEPPRPWENDRERHLAEVLSIILDAARPGDKVYDIVLTIDDLTYEGWKRLRTGENSEDEIAMR